MGKLTPAQLHFRKAHGFRSAGQQSSQLPMPTLLLMQRSRRCLNISPSYSHGNGAGRPAEEGAGQRPEGLLLVLEMMVGLPDKANAI